MPELSSSALFEVLSALANPHRLQILAALANETNYVSQLAREIGISRPLLIMHLKRLEQAKLVTSKLELSDDGKAMRFYAVTEFDLRLTPEYISTLAKTSGPFVAE
jgi:DNA-binding transcriptional ArsR family regulator